MTKHIHDPYGTICSDCGATLNTESEIEHRQCDDCPMRKRMIGFWHIPFTTRDPYPTWYRRLPVKVLMPWRNLGCLGVHFFFVYFDFYRTWRFPYVGMFLNVHGWRSYPIAWLRNHRLLRRQILDGWCHLWCWLQDHTGTGRFNRLIVHIAERVTPADW